MSFRLVVGLGNAGREYDGTRHNVGFYVVDAFADCCGGMWRMDACRMSECAKVVSGGHNVILSKPTTFMNCSGDAVVKLSNYYRIPSMNIVVIYDDIAFPIGDYRINAREGTGGHNGVADILSKIGGGFIRYRIGVGHKRHKDMDLRDHVLSKFSAEEKANLDIKIPEILNCLQLLLDKGVEHAMSLTNRKKVL